MFSGHVCKLQEVKAAFPVCMHVGVCVCAYVCVCVYVCVCERGVKSVLF